MKPETRELLMELDRKIHYVRKFSRKDELHIYLGQKQVELLREIANNSLCICTTYLLDDEQRVELRLYDYPVHEVNEKSHINVCVKYET